MAIKHLVFKDKDRKITKADWNELVRYVDRTLPETTCFGVDYGRDPARAVMVHTPLVRNVTVITHKRKGGPVKIRNRFYVGHPRMSDFNNQSPDVAALPESGRGQGRRRWAQPTVEAAVEHARELLEDDPKLEHAVIVKIIKVVRRKKLPVVVEDVRG